MPSIELKFSDEEFKQAEETSRILNLTLEELIKSSVESTIALTHVLRKELHQDFKHQTLFDSKSSSTN